MTYPEYYLKELANKANLKSLKNSLYDEARRVGKGRKPVTNFAFDLLNKERLRLVEILNNIEPEKRKSDDIAPTVQRYVTELSKVLGVKLIQKSWC